MDRARYGTRFVIVVFGKLMTLARTALSGKMACTGTRGGTICVIAYMTRLNSGFVNDPDERLANCR